MWRPPTLGEPRPTERTEARAVGAEQAAARRVKRLPVHTHLEGARPALAHRRRYPDGAGRQARLLALARRRPRRVALSAVCAALVDDLPQPLTLLRQRGESARQLRKGPTVRRLRFPRPQKGGRSAAQHLATGRRAAVPVEGQLVRREGRHRHVARRRGEDVHVPRVRRDAEVERLQLGGAWQRERRRRPVSRRIVPRRRRLCIAAARRLLHGAAEHLVDLLRVALQRRPHPCVCTRALA
mmetsp:Transcript_11077/g.36827  ORF Transcript_11077/g.36827 Transcript_11077/m.36827 type:complete len:240 (-) Transcript_11077:607-1326(-)